jgi:glycosyltransferase involved in cell wall biosynthesis
MNKLDNLINSKVTVVLPNYNHGKFLFQAIEKINSQSLPPKQIILIDDFSTDDSANVIEKLAKIYENIKPVFNATNRGTISCMNIGLELCQTELINFAAADDLVHSHLFELSVKYHQANPTIGITSCRAKVVDKDTGARTLRPIFLPKKISRPMNASQAKREFRRNDNWILTGTAVYKTDFLKRVGPFEKDLGAAADGFLARKMAMTTGIIFFEYLGLTWNIYNFGQSRRQLRTWDENREALQLIQKRLESDPNFPKWYTKKYLKRFNFAVGRIAIQNKDLEIFQNLYRKNSLVTFLVRRAFRFKILALTLIYIKYQPFSFWLVIKKLLTQKNRFELLS